MMELVSVLVFLVVDTRIIRKPYWNSENKENMHFG